MKISDFEKDQLTEAVTIGAGNASAALSKLADKIVKVDVPDIFVGRVEKVSEFFGNSEGVVTAVLVEISGEVSGMILLIFSPESAVNMARILNKTGHDGLSELDRSALREVGNIVSGNCLTALARFLGFNMIQSVPDSATDMLGAVTDSLIAGIGTNFDTVLAFQIKFYVEEESVSGKFLFIFDPATTEKILGAIRKKFPL